MRALLTAAGVLLLHGPPRHPGYDGQLERQNRDHRAWLAGNDEDEELEARCAAMREAMNRGWRRAALGWRTPQELWQARPVLTDDRAALREEVRAYAAQVRSQGHVRGMPADFPERLAIEQALTRRGYLRRERGGWC